MFWASLSKSSRNLAWGNTGPEAKGTMTYRHISRIKLALLLMRGELDPYVGPWELETLADLARDSGNDQVRVTTIPAAKHDCMENSEGMVKEIIVLFSQYSVG
jgi:alpha-beta hydrolase superfamily lysophospholipase